MRKIVLILTCCCAILSFAQNTVTGKVVEQYTEEPIDKVEILIGNLRTTTDMNGNFSFSSTESKLKIIFKKLGYETQMIEEEIPFNQPLKIILINKITEIEEVTMSTGYQKIPKERSTGSFSSITNSLLDQQVGANILERLEAIGNGMSLDRGTSETPQLMIRGISTINGPKSPLIVVDNFPYEGNISNLNPNIVESITLLKDASAASIWGARAANGVIVITTKNGIYNQPLSLEIGTSLTLAPKPDLGYLKNIGTSDFIEVERELFKRGFYDSEINAWNRPALSPVVDLLNKEKNGHLSNDEVLRQIALLQTIDSRDQFRKYIYQPMENRQYFMNAKGGTQKFAWSSALGYDDNTTNLGATYKRSNIRFQNTWKPTEKFTINTAVYYTDTRLRNGKPGYGAISMKNGNAVPYIKLADQNGNPLAVTKDINQNFKDSFKETDVLDWNYYPLTDWLNDRQKTNEMETILNTGIQYKIFNGLDADVKYQYQRQNSVSENLHGENSYYTRNFVNNFAQVKTDGSVNFIVPKGGILDKYNGIAETHNIRGQINFNRKWNRHGIVAIGGAETRQSKIKSETSRFYGFNEQNLSFGNIDYVNQYPRLVTGSYDYIQNNQSLGERNTRFVSLFANSAYTYNNKYTISGSIRRDASNLFGLKTNDQWNPFWSTGVAWEISKEGFFQANWLPYLKLRGSYGFNGNIDSAMVAVSTIVYDGSNSFFINVPMARFDNYYNPELRWETSRMINIGLDFSTSNDRISGSIEYFTKKGIDLFGPAELDYTTGISRMTANVAETKGNGFDLELKTLNINSVIKWSSIINLSTFKDEVTQYNITNTMAQHFIGFGHSVPISGMVGYPVYSIFAYKWAGLAPETGDPQGYLNGEISKNYTSIVGNGTEIKDLKFFGSALPTVYGSLINSWSYKNFKLDVGISYKLGYWFRRNSINYTNLYNSWIGHSDYSERWQKPGDELYTKIPSMAYGSNANRDTFYKGSSVLVEKGDHVRLQYINLAYQLKNKFNNPQSKFYDNLSVYFNLANLGLLWKANKQEIDPDYNIGINSLKIPLNITLGLRAKF